MRRRGFVLLDRDGTVIEEKHYLHRPGEVALLPGAVTGLRRLREAGFGLVLITNQAGVGRGYYGEADVWLVHARLRELLHQEGIYFDGIYYCPHHPDAGCRCRKPEPALVEDAERELGLRPHQCFMVGDNRCDVNLGRRVGARTVLVTTGHGRAVADDPDLHPDVLAADLDEAARWICRVGRRTTILLPRQLSPGLEPIA